MLQTVTYAEVVNISDVVQERHAITKKVKVSHTRCRALGLELIRMYRQSARIYPAVGYHYFPPDLRLPSQRQSITAPKPVPSYTAR